MRYKAYTKKGKYISIMWSSYIQPILKMAKLISRTLQFKCPPYYPFDIY